MDRKIGDICFFCGGHQDLTTLFPMGGIYTGIADHGCPLCLQCIAPHQAAIFEVVEQDPGCGNPKVQDGVWFTGRWTCVPKSYLTNIYPADTAARVAQGGAGTLNAFRYRNHRLDVYQPVLLH